jgi:predicted transposase YbfD/YdcC
MAKRPSRILDKVKEAFGTLGDPRIDRTKHHSLVNILVMSLCAVIANAEGWDDIADFAEDRRTWFEEFLDLPHGTPSADTFRRVFERLDPKAFNECFVTFVKSLARELTDEVVAIDGKTLRGLVESAGKTSQLHLVHVWATAQGLLLAQEAVKGAPGEMAAIPRLLQLLDLKGAVVTTDANSCTAPVTRSIIGAGADYLLTVKGNRGHFFDFVVDGFKANPNLPSAATHTETERGHGRDEKRVVSVLELHDWPEKTKKNGAWEGLRTAVKVVRTRKVKGKVAVETHYYVSSLPPDPKRLGEVVRAHWGVENCLHWVLDVAFNDDDRRVHNARAAENIAIVARIALTLVKQDPARKRGVAASRRKASWNPDYLTHLLTSGKSIV